MPADDHRLRRRSSLPAQHKLCPIQVVRVSSPVIANWVRATIWASDFPLIDAFVLSQIAEEWESPREAGWASSSCVRETLTFLHLCRSRCLHRRRGMHGRFRKASCPPASPHRAWQLPLRTGSEAPPQVSREKTGSLPEASRRTFARIGMVFFSQRSAGRIAVPHKIGLATSSRRRGYTLIRVRSKAKTVSIQEIGGVTKFPFPLTLSFQKFKL